MTKADFIRKISSRKFWMAVAGFVADLIIAFRGDAALAETVSGLIIAGATVIAYVFAEGLADAANAEEAVDHG